MTTDRRTFLTGSLFAGGVLMIGNFPDSATARDVASGEFGPFIRIASDSTVTVISKFSELGQGNQSGMAALVAEELDADWSRIMVETAPAKPVPYQRGKSGRMLTGGSGSIPDSWMQLRLAGASARAQLVKAASQLWVVAETEITVKDGVILHQKSKRSTAFGPLIEAASKVILESAPTLKRPADFTLIGTTRAGRLDAAAKSDGSAVFTQDVRLPDMLVAMVAHGPRFGSVCVSDDAARVRSMPGVVDVFRISSGVAIVAQSTWAAKKARDALTIEWDDSKSEKRSASAILSSYRAIADGKVAADWAVFEKSGQAEAAFVGDAKPITLTLDFPFLAHAAMEPMNCVAQVEPGKRARLTFGCQAQSADQAAAAKIVRCAVNDVEIVTLPAGGSFGRRSVATSDYQREAVEIAQKIGSFTPVKLVWTREDDMKAGYYRPMAHHRARIAVDSAGYPTAWEHRLVSPSLVANTPLAAMIRNGIDPTVIEGTEGSPYLTATPQVDARVHMPPATIPVLWLRSVGATHTAMAMEHFIDQLAVRAKIDPVVYRRTLYQRAKAEAHLAVLEKAAQLSGWDGPIEPGWARGVAVHQCFGSTVANVAEVTLVDGLPQVRRVLCVVDCGTAVSPDQVRAQMEGGIVYGLTYTLFGEVMIEDGIVQTANFDSYRVLRMNEMPRIEVHILPSDKPPTGVGEPGTPVIGPAVASALLRLTGKPVTALPLVKS